jgi:DNA-damage-inducible protein D
VSLSCGEGTAYNRDMSENVPDLFHFDEARPSFEQLARENGFRYWLASDLAQALGMPGASALRKAIERAQAASVRLGIPISDNFDAVRDAEPGECRLSRFACYLVTMNADPKKYQRVAEAQAWFAALADEVHRYANEVDSVERIAVRAEVSEREKSLNGVAHAHGVVNYQFFQSEGYRGLYNMNISTLRRRKGVPDGRTPLDFMGKEELAANLFRITQTEAKVRNESIRGQPKLERAAFAVGQEVRSAMARISGTRPEDLPLAPDIKHVERDVKRVKRDFQRLDKPKQR